jgi:serine/threonine protein phosphatase PrpC
LRTEGHISITRADVRGYGLQRHAAKQYDRNRAFAITTGLGLPRTWQYTAEGVLHGFGQGLEQSHDQGKSRLQDAFTTARGVLIERCEALIEHQVPDATLTACLLDGSDLHVLCAGAGRAYLHRQGNPQRLTPRDKNPDGLLHARPVRCSIVVEPGDLIIAGSASAFSVRAIGRVAAVLEEDPNTPASVIADLLTAPANESGTGAAAIALRVV